MPTPDYTVRIVDENGNPDARVAVEGLVPASEVASSDHTHAAPAASAVTVTPAGGIAADDVQAALEELDAEKSGTAHTHESSGGQQTLLGARSGAQWCLPGWRAPSVQAGLVGSGYIYYVPVLFQEGATYDQWGINVAVVGGAGTLMRLGVYAMDPTDFSIGDLVVDLGTVPVHTSTGDKTAAISPVLDLNGPHWLAHVSDGGPQVVNFNSGTGVFSGYGTTLGTGPGRCIHIATGQSAKVSAGFPTTPVAPNTDPSATDGLWIRLRQVVSI